MCEWIDILQLCKAVASELDFKNPMLHSPSFSLFDSMSAVELMDPKTDPCFNIQPPLSIDEIVTSNIPSEMSEFDVIRVLKTLIINETAFLDGASLLESINQCVFAWPQAWNMLTSNDNTEGRVLAAYCRDLVSSSSLIISSTLSADIYEDEDFAPSSKVTTEQDSEVELSEIRSGITTFSESHVNNTLIIFLKYRQELHQLYKHVDILINTSLRVHHNMRRGDHASVEDIKANNEQFNVLFSNVINSSQQMLEHVKILQDAMTNHAELDVLYNYLSTQTTSVTPSINQNDDIKNEQCGLETKAKEPLFENFPVYAYDFKILKILQVNPIRKIHFKSYSESLQSIEVMCHAFVSISQQIHKFMIQSQHIPLYTRVSTCTTSTTGGESTDRNKSSNYTAPSASSSTSTNTCIHYEQILYYLASVSESNYNVLIRSYLWACLLTLKPFTNEYVKTSFLLYHIPHDIVYSELTDQWLTHSVSPRVWDIFKTFVICRNKICGRFNIILERCAHIHREAGIIDSNHASMMMVKQQQDPNMIPEFIPPNISEQWYLFWTLQNTSFFMDMYMSLMLEMNLVSIAEMDMFYWYWDYIISTRLYYLKNLNELAYNKLKSKYDLNMKLMNEYKKVKNNKRLKEMKKIVNAQHEPKPYETTIEEIALQCKGLLCKGQFRLYLSLLNYNHKRLIDKEASEYSSWTSRFANRFRNFQCLENPPWLTFIDYCKTIQHPSYHGISVLELCDSITNNFKASKANYEKLKSVCDDKYLHYAYNMPVNEKYGISFTHKDEIIINDIARCEYFVRKLGNIPKVSLCLSVCVCVYDICNVVISIKCLDLVIFCNAFYTHFHSFIISIYILTTII